MKVDDCKKCEFIMEALTDSILCRYNREVEHRVTDRGNVVACPKEHQKRKVSFSLFKGA